MTKRSLSGFSLLYFSVAAIAVLIGGVEAHTIPNAWVGHGPGPNLISYSLAIDPSNPNIVYTGTTDGVFKSIDYSETWGPKSVGLPVDPCFFPCVIATPRTVFAPQS